MNADYRFLCISFRKTEDEFYHTFWSGYVYSTVWYSGAFNTATATLVLPVMGALAGAVDVLPLYLMVPAAVAASYAFMLPVATPPNAIIFSSRYVTIPQMARTGLWMNLLASLVITAFVVLLLPVIQ